MIKVKRIDHVAIAVADRDDSAGRLRGIFQLAETAREHVADQKADVAFLACGDSDAPGCDATAIEIVAPAGNAGLERFLSKRGPGLHHICFEVDDIDGALADLKAAGVPLIDEVARPGARGHRVAFLNPAATGGVLFELCAPSENQSKNQSKNTQSGTTSGTKTGGTSGTISSPKAVRPS
jgi:methylmalonyl-CoA/ethylmalonyl-CoA epimerase